MPSTSAKQHNLMAAVAHNPAFAKKVGIPQSVGKEFNEADKMKRRKFADGGKVKMESKVASYFAKKDEKKLAAHERREAAGKEEDTKAIAKKEERVLKGAPKAMKNYEKKEHKQMGFKGGGAMPKMMQMMKPKKARRPMAVPPSGGPMAAGLGAMGAGAPPMGMGMKKGGSAKKMASGGSFRTSANGIASKGKTKGKQVTMKNGGKC